MSTDHPAATLAEPTGDGRLAGHTAVVTGAANGIGQAIAARLGADGARVAVVDLADAADTVAAITAAGGTAVSFAADVSRPDRIKDLLKEVGEALGPVDVLVNNVGIYPTVPFAELEHAQWQHVFAVNVDSMFLTAQAFLPAMTQRGWGRIVNLTSNSIALTAPGMVHYVASKMAVIGLTRGLASEVGTQGVTVNAIAPSIVRTPARRTSPRPWSRASPRRRQSSASRSPTTSRGPSRSSCPTTPRSSRARRSTSTAD